ncbi:hypothetical protein ACLB2K_002092 [Fragaria x ananassa]
MISTGDVIFIMSIRSTMKAFIFHKAGLPRMLLYDESQSTTMNSASTLIDLPFHSKITSKLFELNCCTTSPEKLIRDSLAWFFNSTLSLPPFRSSSSSSSPSIPIRLSQLRGNSE